MNDAGKKQFIELLKLLNTTQLTHL